MPNAPAPRKPNNLRKWRGLFNLTVLSAYFYVSMEWLFFATKPSSLSTLSAFESAKVLFITAGTVALIFAALLALLSIPALIVGNSNWRSRLLIIGCIVPALVLSITALIMLDNFTYTVYEFGIVKTKGSLRWIYALGFLLFFLWRLYSAKQAVWARRKFASYLTLGLLTISLTGILASKLSNNSLLGSLDIASLNSSSTGQPNIIFLGSDGLSARYLTAYLQSAVHDHSFE